MIDQDPDETLAIKVPSRMGMVVDNQFSDTE